MLRHLLTGTLYAAAVAGLYFVVGWAERRAAADVTGANAVWWPVGLAAVAGWRRPRAAAVGAMAGDYAFTFLDGFTGPAQVASAAGNGLEVVVTGLVLRRAGFDPRLARVRDVLALTAAAVVGGLAFLATMAVAAAFGAFGPGWLATEGPVSFAGDAVGVLLIGAVGFPWLAPGRRSRRFTRPSAETLALLVLLAGVTGLAFAPAAPAGWRSAVIPASYPLLVWAAVRCGRRTLSVAVAVHAAAAVAVVLRDGGPFHGLGLPRGSYPYLHLYFVAAVGTALLLAAARAEGDRSAAALREAQRMESLGQLAGGVAHEFNNLMTVILGNAQLIRLGPPPTADPNDLLKQIEAAAERAGVLTRQLLAFTGRGPITLRTLDARPAVRAALDRVHHGLSAAAPPDLPAVVADPALLGMAVENVTRNALEAVHGLPDRVWVSLASVRLTAADLDDPRAGSAARPGRFLRVRVADDGAGVPSEVVYKMFDPFFSTKAGRRGLGLAAALGAMKACGGLIRVSSVLDVGTTIDLFVPTADTAPPVGRGSDPGGS